MILQLSQIESKKGSKNQGAHYDRLLKFILKQVIKNTSIKTETKK